MRGLRKQQTGISDPDYPHPSPTAIKDYSAGHSRSNPETQFPSRPLHPHEPETARLVPAETDSSFPDRQDSKSCGVSSSKLQTYGKVSKEDSRPATPTGKRIKMQQIDNQYCFTPARRYSFMQNQLRNKQSIIADDFNANPLATPRGSRQPPIQTHCFARYKSNQN